MLIQEGWAGDPKISLLVGFLSFSSVSESQAGFGTPGYLAFALPKDDLALKAGSLERLNPLWLGRFVTLQR